MPSFSNCCVTWSISIPALFRSVNIILALIIKTWNHYRESKEVKMLKFTQELENFPWFRKQLGMTAFVEGWALYAESLGYEMGMYKDKYQHYGALTYEMERACRLVMDTGLHYKKWTRKQAFDYMKSNTPTSEVDIRAEVDRYVVWPGQALAYKIGELKIRELRKLAKDELKDKFDLKEFHDHVLMNGAIPLSLLEKNIKEWIASKSR